MNKIRALLLLLSFFLFSRVGAVKFWGVSVPISWKILNMSYEDIFEENNEAIVIVEDGRGKVITYKIYLEEILNNTERVKIRVAYKFSEGVWINFDEEKLITKNDLRGNFRIRLRIESGGNPEIIIYENKIIICKNYDDDWFELGKKRVIKRRIK